MRRAARTDANQAEIVAALRSRGALVQDLSAVGGGVPDLLVGYAGRLMLIEIKDGSKSRSRRALTPVQKLWHEAWRPVHVHVVESVDEVNKLLESLQP